MKKKLSYLLIFLLIATCFLSCTKDEDTIIPKVKNVTISSYSYSDQEVSGELLKQITKQTFNEQGQLISSDNEMYMNGITLNFNFSFFYEGDKVVKQELIEKGPKTSDIQTTVYTYDNNKHCLSEAITSSNTQILPYTIYHQYDQNGWLIIDSMSINNGAEIHIERHYKDKSGCDTLLIDGYGGISHMKYDSKNKVIESIYYNNTITVKTFSSYDYDTKGRVVANKYLYINEDNNVEYNREYIVENYYYQPNDSIDSIIYMRAPDKNAELIKTQKTIYAYEYFEN